MIEITNTSKLEELQALTREYAMYSRSAAGLGNALGGIIGIGIGLIAAFADPPLWVRALLTLALPIWFFSKAWLRTHHYQRRGAALESLDKTAANMERFSQGALGGIAVVMLVVCLFLVITNPAKIASLPALNKLALVASPLFGLLLCRRINTLVEMLVAMNLMVQTVILSSGSALTWRDQGTMFVWAGCMILIGAVEHFRFRKVENQLRGLQL
jgi:hypothetical protein